MIEAVKRPDDIVLGTGDGRARTVLQELYRPLYLNQAPVVWASRRTAELTKCAANPVLATTITFDAIAVFCPGVGADGQEVARGSGSTTGSALTGGEAQASPMT